MRRELEEHKINLCTGSIENEGLYFHALGSILALTPLLRNAVQIFNLNQMSRFVSQTLKTMKIKLSPRREHDFSGSEVSHEGHWRALQASRILENHALAWARA